MRQLRGVDGKLLTEAEKKERHDWQKKQSYLKHTKPAREAAAKAKRQRLDHPLVQPVLLQLALMQQHQHLFLQQQQQQQAKIATQHLAQQFYELQQQQAAQAASAAKFEKEKQEAAAAAAKFEEEKQEAAAAAAAAAAVVAAVVALPLPPPVEGAEDRAKRFIVEAVQGTVLQTPAVDSMHELATTNWCQWLRDYNVAKTNRDLKFIIKFGFDACGLKVKGAGSGEREVLTSWLDPDNTRTISTNQRKKFRDMGNKGMQIMTGMATCHIFADKNQGIEHELNYIGMGKEGNGKGSNGHDFMACFCAGMYATQLAYLACNYFNPKFETLGFDNFRLGPKDYFNIGAAMQQPGLVLGRQLLAACKVLNWCEGC